LLLRPGTHDTQGVSTDDKIPAVLDAGKTPCVSVLSLDFHVFIH
jgi:hypothetical protein